MSDDPVEPSSSERMVRLTGGRLDQISTKDVRRRHISGTWEAGQRFHGNLVECRIENASFSDIDFSRCDWKDCRIVGSTFKNCNLGGASFITNLFEDCDFRQCTFYDTGMSDCVFRDCRFELSDFTALIVKTSRLEGCLIDQCITSNRLVESSLILHTTWRRTDIEAALVLGNFGVRRGDLVECNFVSRLSDGSRARIAGENVVPHLLEDRNSIERFRAAYFIHEAADGDADALENALDLRNWRSEAILQATFGAQLLSFSQFLLALYAADELPFYPLLLLHSRNFEFMEWLEQRDDVLPLYQTVAGVHLSLTREVDSFVSRLQRLGSMFDSTRVVHFAAEGPLEPTYFESWLQQSGLDLVRVVAVRPRNSPVDLALSFLGQPGLVGLLALFLATRLRVELLSFEAATGAPGGLPAPQSTQLMVFSTGFSVARPSEYELNVRTILPRSLLLDLNIAVNVGVFQRARATLVGLLSSPTAPIAPERRAVPKSASRPKRSRSPRA